MIAKRRDDGLILSHKVSCSQYIPSLLHACHESRHEAKKWYSQAFGRRLTHPVYFDYENDFLVMKGDKYCNFSGVRTLQAFLFCISTGEDYVDAEMEELHQKPRNLVIGGEKGMRQ